MNKKGEVDNYLKVILLLIITILIAFAFLNPVADRQNTMSAKQLVYNATSNLDTLGCYNASGYVNQTNSACNITVSKWVTSDWRASDSQCDIGTVTLTNSTGEILVLNTDYNLYATDGLIGLLDTLKNSNVSTGDVQDNEIYINYDYCDAGYLQNSGDRSLIKLITTMMIIALLIVTVGVVHKMWNR